MSSAGKDRRTPIAYATTCIVIAVFILVAYAEFGLGFVYFRLDLGWIVVTSLVTLLGTLALLSELEMSLRDSEPHHPLPPFPRAIGPPCLIAAVIIGLGSVTAFGFYEGIFLALMSAAQAGILTVVFVLLLNAWIYLARFRGLKH